MRFSVWPGVAGQPWDEVLAVAQHAEVTGWDGVWVADHFMTNDARRGPYVECWSALAALAAVVPRVRLGSLVTSLTYRHPAVLANIAATTDVISDGRLVLGVGAGWQENEHRAYGLDLPPVPERLARFEEGCEVLRALLHGSPASFDGRWYRLVDAPLEPRPVQERLPLLVGGSGERVTMRIAAQHADEWNCWGTPELHAHKREVLDRHCAAVGRDPGAVARSAQAVVLLDGHLPELERLAAAGRPVLRGSPAQLQERVAAYAAAGVGELVVPDLSTGPLADRLRMLDAFLEGVVQPVRAAQEQGAATANASA